LVNANASLPAAPVTSQTLIAVTNTAVQLPSGSITQGFVVQALPTNVGTVYIGPSGVTSSTGFPLTAGQSTGEATANTNTTYVVGANVGDGVAIIGS
jgi:hypothetical protein